MGQYQVNYATKVLRMQLFLDGRKNSIHRGIEDHSVMMETQTHYEDAIKLYGHLMNEIHQRDMEIERLQKPFFLKRMFKKKANGK